MQAQVQTSPVDSCQADPTPELSIPSSVFHPLTKITAAESSLDSARLRFAASVPKLMTVKTSESNTNEGTDINELKKLQDKLVELRVHRKVVIIYEETQTTEK